MSDMYKSADKLFNDTPQIRVPVFQRAYTWQGSQVEQLLDDIDNIKIEYDGVDFMKSIANHFCGLLVFVRQDGGALYEVVDGQQRLSTIVLIAAAAKDVIGEYLQSGAIIAGDIEKLTIAKNYYEKIVYRELKPYGTKIAKLIPNVEDEALYECLVKQDGGISQKTSNVENNLGKTFLRKRYFKAYETIHQYLTDKVNVNGKSFFAEFLVKMSEGLTFIEFVVNKEEDAFNLFETLNDRGINLSAMDLIKNKVLQKAEGNVEEYTVMWNAVFGKDGIVEPSRSQPFLRNYLMLRAGHITNSLVYVKCKDYLATAASTKEFLEDINKDASFYTAITSPKVVASAGDNDIAELLLLLNKTRVRQWQSLGYCAYGLYKDEIINKSDLIMMLKLLLNICVRFKIMNLRFNYLEKQLPEYAKILKKRQFEDESGNIQNMTVDQSIEKVKTLLRDEIIKKIAPDVQFGTKLDADYMFDENDLPAILLRLIESKKTPHGYLLDLDLTLEHVLPEQHKKYWGDVLNVDRLKYSLGNMLLVKMDPNIKLSNKKLADKKEVYCLLKVFDSVTNESLKYVNADQELWVNSFILAREKDLIAQIKDILKVP